MLSLAFFTVWNAPMALAQSTEAEACPDKDGVIRYKMTSARTGLNGIYLFKFFNNKDTRFDFDEGAYMDVYTNGTARIRGIIRPSEAGVPEQAWKVDFLLHYTKKALPKVNGYVLSADDWKYFRLNEKKSKIINLADKKDVIRIKAMQRDDCDDTYALQVGDQAALIDAGLERGVFGASTWFMYSRDGENWLGGDINVILDKGCETVKPLSLEAICSDKPNMFKWKISNENHRSVRLEYKDYKGRVKTVFVKSAKKGGEREFYTSILDGQVLELRYAVSHHLAPLMADASEATDCEPVCKESSIIYSLESARYDEQNNPLNGIYLMKFEGNPFVRFKFDHGATMEIFANGTGRVRGVVRPAAGSPVADQAWKVLMNFKFEKNATPKVNGYVKSTEFWRYFRVVEKNTKMVNLADPKDIILIKPMEKMPEDGEGEYAYQVGDQAALIGKGLEQGIFGGSTWFMYTRDGGQRWDGGDINVIMHEECVSIQPVEFTAICTDKVDRFKWRLTNPNKRAVLMYYVDQEGIQRTVRVPGKDRAPYKDFYTKKDRVDANGNLTLYYAAAHSLGSLSATATDEICTEAPPCDKWTVSMLVHDLHSDEYTKHSSSPRSFVFFKLGKLSMTRGYLTYKKKGHSALIVGEGHFLDGSLKGTQWEIFVPFKRKNSKTEPKREMKSEVFTDNGGFINDEEWMLFLVANGAELREVDMDGDYTGNVIELTQRPSDGKHGLQIGFGANGKNIGMGASTWFHWNLNDEQSGDGDINIDLTPLCVDTPCDEEYVSNLASSFSGNGHSVWLKGFNDGKNAQLHFTEEASFTYREDLKAGYLFGELETELLGETGWRVFATFGQADENIKPKYEKGGENEQGASQRDLESSWEYLVLLKGKIVSADGSKIIKINAMDMPYGMQIGYSASGKNWEYGASTWFEWEFEGKKNQGDFNLNLETICKEKMPPMACAEFTLTSTCTGVGHQTTIILDCPYTGAFKYSIASQQTGQVLCTYQGQFENGKANITQGLSNLQSGQYYLLIVETKDKLYSPFRFTK